MRALYSEGGLNFISSGLYSESGLLFEWPFCEGGLNFEWPLLGGWS